MSGGLASYPPLNVLYCPAICPAGLLFCPLLPVNLYLFLLFQVSFSGLFQIACLSYLPSFLLSATCLSCLPLPPYKNSILQFYKNVNTFFIKYFYFLQKKQKLRPAFNLLTLLFFLLSYFENVPHAVLQFFSPLHSLSVLFVPLLMLAISCLSLFLVPKRNLEKFRKKL